MQFEISALGWEIQTRKLRKVWVFLTYRNTAVSSTKIGRCKKLSIQLEYIATLAVIIFQHCFQAAPRLQSLLCDDVCL